MLKEDVVKSVAYCGLICHLDSCYENCGGCKQGRGCGDKDCYQKNCCIEKSLNGCWECDISPCNKGYFSDKEDSNGQFIACIKFIKEFGVEQYIDTIKINIGIGIKYGLGGDYGKKSEDEVMKLLKRE
jgi:hypothetical protein